MVGLIARLRGAQAERRAKTGPAIGTVAMLSLAWLSGCGPQRPPTYRVDGLVRDAAGGVIERASVTFLSGDSSNGDLTLGRGVRYRAEGIVGEGGRFTLTTFQPGDGAVAGPHQVLIVPLPPGDGPTAAGPQISSRYEHPDRSGLIVEIRPQAMNEVVLVVQWKPDAAK
jgi:hypothetical protein